MLQIVGEFVVKRHGGLQCLTVEWGKGPIIPESSGGCASRYPVTRRNKACCGQSEKMQKPRVPKQTGFQKRGDGASRLRGKGLLALGAATQAHHAEQAGAQ